MNRSDPNILSIPSPFSIRGTIKVLESASTDPASILDQLFRGEYDRPFLLEDGETRFLYFSFAHVQSAMCIRNPDELELAYTRKMMSFALFNPKPRKILMLGLGGGCHDCCGPVLATVAEIRRMPQIGNKIRENALADFNCVHLGKSGCQIYENRPLICRLFGTTKNLACPRGIRPEKVASQRVERAIFRILSSNELRLI